MDSHGEAPEEYEQIPWSHLAPVQRDRTLQLAILVGVIIASLLAVVLALRRSPAATTANPPAVTAPLVATTEVAFEPEPAAEPPVPTTAVPQPRIYSEADLMAALPPRPELEAIARAEWFVTDFFTVDGDGGTGAEVAAVLPDVMPIPETDGGAISYVEWARAVAVADDLDGSYVVTVWFRTLAGDAAAGFERTAVRAVDVQLVTDAQGRLAVADVPVIAAVAPAGIPPSWPQPTAADPDVVAAAASEAADFGDEPQLEAAGRDEDGWRLVFSVGDASGLRFPLVVRAPTSGS